MLDSLKPCPFCGGAATAHDDTADSPMWIAGCCSAACALQPSVYGETKADVVAAWNRRALPAPAAGEPELPDVDTRMQIPYESIRYVAGYTEQFVKQYARAYGQAMAEHARRVAPGYVLMPEEMTEAMEDAAHEAAYIWRHTEWRAAERARYAAIRAAAPPQGEPK